jgi:hypothetical protein
MVRFVMAFHVATTVGRIKPRVPPSQVAWNMPTAAVPPPPKKEALGPYILKKRKKETNSGQFQRDNFYSLGFRLLIHLQLRICNDF